MGESRWKHIVGLLVALGSHLRLIGESVGIENRVEVVFERLARTTLSPVEHTVRELDERLNVGKSARDTFPICLMLKLAEQAREMAKADTDELQAGIDAAHRQQQV